MAEVLLKVFLVICVVIASAVIVLLVMRIADDRKVNRIWQSLELEPGDETFTEDMVAELPAPARSYFQHSIKPGTMLASSVRLEMSGVFRLKSNAAWTPMTAQQVLSLPKGSVWKATIGRGLVKFSGVDYYAGGVGRMLFRLWGLIPLVHAESQDITRSSIGRFAGEAFWLPSALLPQRGVKWRPIDDESAKATLEVGGETVELTFFVRPDGMLMKIVFQRWGDRTEDGHFTYIPFGGEVKEERSFGGYTIPSRVCAGWWYGTDRYFEFFRATVEKAEFR